MWRGKGGENVFHSCQAVHRKHDYWIKSCSLFNINFDTKQLFFSFGNFHIYDLLRGTLAATLGKIPGERSYCRGPFSVRIEDMFYHRWFKQNILEIQLMHLIHLSSAISTRTIPRVDVVFDRYRNTSIKSGVQSKREGQMRSIRRKIDSRDIPLPANWTKFMDLPENKTNLTYFISAQLMMEERKTHPTRNVITAAGFEEQTAVASSQESDVHLLQSSHEEADTRIILHAKAACRDGYERVIVSCRDTNVLVLLTHFAGQLSQQLCMRAGTRQQMRYIAVHNIELTPRCRRTSYHTHAVTRGKTTCKWHEKHSALLNDLGHDTLSESTIRSVEEFFCRIFSPGSDETNINDIRSHMFQKGTKEQEKIPSTRKSFEQHIHRCHDGICHNQYYSFGIESDSDWL